MITDTDGRFVVDNFCISCWVMDYYRRISALNNVDGDVESTAQSNDLWFTAPNCCISHGCAIVVEFRSTHHACVERTAAIFSLRGRQKWQEVVVMRVNEISSCDSEIRISGLVWRKYS